MQQVSVLETNIGSSTTGNSANTQIIFNDAGTLRGDAGLTYNAATDTLTAGSATITGDLTVDTSTLKVDSTNNRVGILTASPRSPFALDVLGNVALGDSTTTTSVRLKLDCLGTAGNVAVMSFATAGTNKAFYGLSGGFLGDASTDALIGTDAAGAGIRFYVSNTGAEVARFNSTGNLAFANGKGIDFSATSEGGGTMTSELLNDYEEGTFTATLKGSTTDPTTPVTSTARYTKIGRVVNVVIYFGNVNTTGASGAVQVIGLPFTSGSGPFYPGSAVSGDTATFTGTLGAWIAPASTQVDVLASVSGGSVTGATHNAGAGRYLALNVTYTV